MASYVVIRSEYIATAEEARDYYRAKLAGLHTVTSDGRPVTIVFEHDVYFQSIGRGLAGR